MLTISNNYIGIQVVFCALIAFLEDKREILSENLGKFSHREKQHPVSTEWNPIKSCFSVKIMRCFEKKIQMLWLKGVVFLISIMIWRFFWSLTDPFKRLLICSTSYAVREKYLSGTFSTFLRTFDGAPESDSCA